MALIEWHCDITGWENQWFYFDANGYMTTGSINVTDGSSNTTKFWYYINENGTLAVGWKQLNNNWYYLRPDWGGARATDWQTDISGWAGYWFCFDDDGIMYVDTVTPDGHRVDKRGVCVS